MTTKYGLFSEPAYLKGGTEKLATESAKDPIAIAFKLASGHKSGKVRNLAVHTRCEVKPTALLARTRRQHCCSSLLGLCSIRGRCLFPNRS